jgi:hypothetical protein
MAETHFRTPADDVEFEYLQLLLRCYGSSWI